MVIEKVHTVALFFGLIDKNFGLGYNFFGFGGQNYGL